MLPKLENFVRVNVVWIDKFVDKFEYNFFFFLLSEFVIGLKTFMILKL